MSIYSQKAYDQIITPSLMENTSEFIRFRTMYHHVNDCARMHLLVFALRRSYQLNPMWPGTRE